MCGMRIKLPSPGGAADTGPHSAGSGFPDRVAATETVSRPDRAERQQRNLGPMTVMAAAPTTQTSTAARASQVASASRAARIAPSPVTAQTARAERPARTAQTWKAGRAAATLHEDPASTLGDAVAGQLDQCVVPTRPPVQVVMALWEVLQQRTYAQTAASERVAGGNTDQMQERAARTEVPGKDVSARFGDIRLIARTAIVDAVQTNERGGTCYLHANRLTTGCGIDFIASQKPLPSEVGGFLYLLLTDRIPLVVDLTATSEREDDALYVPAAGRSLAVESADVVMTCEQRMRLPGFRSTVESLVIRVGATAGSAGATQHALQRLHFAGWPDHGVIAARTLRFLADQVEILHARDKGAVIVHCMAGVGRTGTLISFIATRRRLREIRASQARAPAASFVAATLVEMILQGRRDRGGGFVQTREQFALVLTALLEEFVGRAGAGREARTGIVSPLSASASSSARGSRPRLPGWRVVAGILRRALGHLTAHYRAARNTAGEGTFPTPAGQDVEDVGVAARGGTPGPAAATGAADMQVPHTASSSSAPAVERAAVPVFASAPAPIPVPVLERAPALEPERAPAPAPARQHVPVSVPRSRIKVEAAPVLPDYSRAIAEDTVLSTYFDEAIARLKRVQRLDEIGPMLAEVVETMRHRRGVACELDALQRDMLQAAVLRRFHRRDKGIIFQAHLARSAMDEGASTSSQKAGAGADTAGVAVQKDA